MTVPTVVIDLDQERRKAFPLPSFFSGVFETFSFSKFSYVGQRIKLPKTHVLEFR